MLADLRLCLSHILHCWKSHVAAHIMINSLHAVKFAHCGLLTFKKNLHRAVSNISSILNLNMVLGAQKNRLIETVLLNTHNICFG